MNRHHGQNTIFASKGLTKCSHIYLRTDSLKKGLEPSHEGPYKIVNRNEKVFQILRRGKEVSVSVDWLKPAYIPKEMMDITAGMLRKEKVSSQPNRFLDTGQNSTGSSSRQEITTRPSHRVRFNPKYS
ncbi:transposon Ty3-I Gag-Pol polyprotein [Nephila pilipes]|uniref:Transposon Ty3-I Gag-Pol polyprotein n=1 Tax=Nephila pilipes TaxID=299642 RepID=A0A8X6UXY7_NEPPI|nr:transposon Ty3-I Gag-Pol polyprotein [Nephila pilipes]